MALYSGILDFISLPEGKFPHRLELNMDTNMLKNSPFCSFTSFSTVSSTNFINKLDSSRDLNIFIMPSNFLFGNINAVASNFLLNSCICS